jgi:hypothetical protein
MINAVSRSCQETLSIQVLMKVVTMNRIHLLNISASRSQIAERVLTCGDIGTASSKLKTEFSPLQHCFEFDDELWWHGGCPHSQENGLERESLQNLKVGSSILACFQLLSCIV